MPALLRVLILKRRPEDAQSIETALHRFGFPLKSQVIENKNQFLDALNQTDWDLVISGFELADFTVLEALDILGQVAPTIPLLLLSGTISEDAAVSVMDRGARDCIHPNSIQRLPLVVAREIETARYREDQKQAEQDRETYRRQLTDLVRNLPVGVYRRTPGPDGKFVMANRRIANVLAIHRWRTSSSVISLRSLSMKPTGNSPIRTLPGTGRWKARCSG